MELISWFALWVKVSPTFLAAFCTPPRASSPNCLLVFPTFCAVYVVENFVGSFFEPWGYVVYFVGYFASKIFCPFSVKCPCYGGSHESVKQCYPGLIPSSDRACLTQLSKALLTPPRIIFVKRRGI
ncbi:hypothetical protein [Alkaliphilus crotonatoxidans]